MIPSHNESGVLPPFLGATPVEPSAMAPYRVALLDLVKKFASNQERRNILAGFIGYRAELQKVGFLTGFQWVGGSFVENVETTLHRPPRDIDIITFSYRPDSYRDETNWEGFVLSRPDLFDPQESKKKYSCDAYFVDLSLGSPTYLIDQTKYWFGLFSHQRDTSLWKGMLEIPLTDDTEVAALFGAGGTNVAQD